MDPVDLVTEIERQRELEETLETLKISRMIVPDLLPVDLTRLPWEDTAQQIRDFLCDANVVKVIEHS